MRPRISILVLGIASAALALSACGSSSKSASSATSPTTAAPAPAGGAATVKTADVPGVGTVLVDAQGRTLYILTSEKGGNVTCTSTGGCTSIWPAVVLPPATMHPVAGSGVHASLLGSVSANGQSRVTYAGYPLYTFTGDHGSGEAHGKGIISFGGTWWPITPSGALVTSSSSSSTSTTISYPAY